MLTLLLSVALRLMPAPEFGTLERAHMDAATCGTPTAWAEQVDPGVWYGVCGDADGNTLRVVGMGDNDGACEGQL